MIYIYMPAISFSLPQQELEMIYKDAKVLAQMLYSFSVFALHSVTDPFSEATMPCDR